MVSQQEKSLLREFRESLDVKFADDLEDYVLDAYLRACKMNVQSAVAMYNKFLEVQNSLTDKKDQKLDYRNYKSVGEISNDIIYKFLGCDNGGRPVYWIPAGRWNAGRHVERGLTNEFWLHVFKCIDEGFLKLFELADNAGVHQKAILIFDLKELTFSKVTNYALARSCVTFLQDFQPLANLLCNIYIVNAPWITNFVMKMMKPYLKSKTSNKIEQINFKENEWKEILRKRFQVDIFPKEFGRLGQPLRV